MTVNTNDRRLTYPGNGTSTVFPGPRLFDADDLAVYEVDDATGSAVLKVSPTYYTVADVTLPQSTVTLVAPLPTGSTLLLLRTIDYTQTTRFRNQGSFFPELHEDEFDRGAMRDQQLAEESGRAIKIPVQVSGVSTTMPVPVGSTFWGWDASGTVPFLYSLTDIATTAAFASWDYDTFTGDGATTDFPLGGSPGTIANMDVSVDGVTQVPGTDYSLLGDTVIFSTAPALDAVVLVRFGQSLPAVGSDLFEAIEVAVTAGQTVVALTGVNGDDVTQVFYNGVLQHPSAYSVAGTTITFTEALPASGAIVAVVSNVPAAGVSAGNIAYTAPGTGASTRRIKARLDDVISVANYATPGHAVAQAVAVDGEVFWPAGDWTAAASVQGLWDVEHRGPGRLLRAAAILPFSPSEADEIDLYVDPTGDDANDGLTTAAPLLTVQRAVDIFVAHGSRGRWTINLAAGTYTENVVLSSLTPMEFPVDIRGPSVGGHPNVPTAIIAAAVTSDDVFSASDNSWCRLYDVLLSGATTGVGLNLQRGRATLTNVHIAGCLGGVINQHLGTLATVGGIWTGLGKATAGGIGFASFYNATHALVAASTPAALIVEDYATGLHLNEGAQGHLDYTVVQDCATGILWQRGAGGCNTDNMTIQRCDVGIAARGQWFNNGIIFGSGADVNTVNVRCAGGAPEFDFRSADYTSKTKRLQSSTYGVSHTGTVAATQIWEFADIRPWMVSEGGDVFEVVAVLNNAASAGTISFSMFLWDGTTEDFLSGVALPIGTTNAQVRALINFSGGAVQRCSVAAIHNAGALCGAYGTGALNLKNLTGALRIKVTLSNAADTATFQFIELHTSLGG